MTLQQLFIDSGISQAFIAEKIGMKRTTFNNKINPDHASKFSPSELVQIWTVLEENCKKIKEYLLTIQ